MCARGADGQGSSARGVGGECEREERKSQRKEALQFCIFNDFGEGGEESFYY